MQKLSIILVILCVLMLQQVKASRRRINLKKNYMIKYKINDTDYETNYTQEIDLTINEDIQSFTLSRNDSHIFVNSSDRSFKPCIIKFKKLGYAFQVAPFNEKIILWDRQTDNEFTVNGTTLLLIDPLVCNIPSNIKIPTDKIPIGQPPYNAQVVTYNGFNCFDIFFGGRTVCMPCRFTGEGENVLIKHQLQNITTEVASPYLIRPLKDSDPNFGYFYAYSFNNGSLWTEINLLHPDFAITRQIYVDHVIDGVAIDDIYHDIVVCYKKEYEKYAHVTLENKTKIWRMILETNVYCDVYDKNLELMNHIKLSIPNDHYVNGIFLSIGKGGTLCVAVPHISYALKDNMYSLSFFRFNSLDRSSMESFGALGSMYENFDEKEGYNLKMKALRMIRMHCP